MITSEPVGAAAASLTPVKVQSRHLERLAIVYVRQSTAQQVLEHRESTALQYALRTRAIQWGWPPERVLVIDEDLGRSGKSAQGRTGFQRLLAEVSLEHVGVVLGIEMSRLARSCRDWHQLLELCALFDTLLADTDGLYDPRSYNDRLLLGLKGTISEAELHVLRQRMHEGRLNKARRGELFNHPPMGYVRQPGGELAMDPDQQVQSVMRLIFEKFDELGTLNALLRYLVRQQIQLPVRPHHGGDRGQLQWRRPSRQTLRNVLHHPIYAGAYTWGRRPTDPRSKVPGRSGTGRKVAAAEACQVLLKDRCPPYITWTQYEANRKQLAENQNRADAKGPPRQGPSLLAGLLACGACGQRMTVQYSGASNKLRYCCTRNYSSYAAPLCQGICGGVLDELVAKQVLAMLEPAAVELSLAAATDLNKEQDRLKAHWQQRLERAQYQVDRAFRQYQAVEPENRLVAGELEKRWEQSLLEQRGISEAHDRFRHEQPTPLNEADRQMLASLCDDVPALWQSAETTPADRQMIVRCLIQQVVLTAPANSEAADVKIHWAGGYLSHHELIRPVARYEQMRDYPRLSSRVIELRCEKLTSAQIAQRLNTEGWRPPKRRTTFNAAMVRSLFYRRGETHTCPAARALAAGEWWFTDLARALNLPHPTLYSWMRRGWVNASQVPIPGGRSRWILWADEEELNRLRQLRACPRSWHCQPQAAELTRPKPRSQS